jgi:hypothetical protein
MMVKSLNLCGNLTLVVQPISCGVVSALLLQAVIIGGCF